MRKILVIFSLFTSLLIHASFVLNGNTITQSNTDTSLMGLQDAIFDGIVTRLSIGTGTDGRVIYSIGNRKLLITGTLTINPELEAIFAGVASPSSVFEISGTGTLNVTGQIIENGIPRYSTQLFMWSPYQNGNCCGAHGLRVRSGGTLNWLGGAIRVGSALSFDAGSNINTTGAILYQDKNGDNQLRQSATNWISTSFQFTGNDITFIAIPNQFNGYEPIGSRGALGFSSSTPNIDFPVLGYASNGSSDSDIRLWAGNRPILTNAKNGSQLKVVPHVSGSGTSYGVAIVKQEVEVAVVDDAGTNIVDAKVYTIDTNNGGREIYSREGHSVNTIDDLSYIQTTLATGKTPVYEIITAFNIVNTGNGDALNTGNYAWDYRGKENANTDLFDFFIVSYNHILTSITTTLKGSSMVKTRATVFKDSFITEPAIATVNTYPGILIDHAGKTMSISANTTLCQLYDYIKANKVATLEFPLPGTLAAEVQGNELFINDYQLIITGTAVLSPCNKFVKIVSSVTSSIADFNVNLKIALTDAISTYKLVQLSNIINGDVIMTDETTSTIITQELDFTGTLNLVTQNNTTNVSVVVSREGYSNWAVTLDLTSADRFILQVSQSVAVPNALLSKQEELLYLSRKILQKNQAIQSVLNDDTVPIINLNSVLQNVEYASDEKQEEMLLILKRILSKTQAIRTTVKE